MTELDRGRAVPRDRAFLADVAETSRRYQRNASVVYFTTRRDGEESSILQDIMANRPTSDQVASACLNVTGNPGGGSILHRSYSQA